MKRMLVLLFACCTLSGCGLLYVPDPVTIPHRSLRRIVVVDRETLEPIEDATVTCTMQRWDNWIRPIVRWEVFTPANEAEGSTRAAQPCGDTGRDWPGEPQGDGIFIIEPKTKLGWTHIMFPLDLPIGGVIRHTYCGAITVSAPGHDTVWFTNQTAVGRGGWSFGYYWQDPTLDPSSYFVIGKKTSTVKLPRSRVSPRE